MVKVTEINQSFINIYSDIGPLKSVLLHRPGQELENLIPDNFEQLLFDDIPFLQQAQKQHDSFAAIMENKGIEVLYLDQLTAESLIDEEIRGQFIQEWLNESNLPAGFDSTEIIEQLNDLDDNLQLIRQTMKGFSKSELGIDSQEGHPLVIDPIPNLYFTRDPFVAIGKGMAINKMYADARQRETLYAKYIFNHHPRFTQYSPSQYYDRQQTTFIEGGDIIVVSQELILMGVSQRSQIASVKKMASSILKQSGFKKIIVISFQKNRKFMHLDTVFTMLDRDKFLIHPEIEFNAKLMTIQNKEGHLSLEYEMQNLKSVLKRELKLDSILFIRCGGYDAISNAREQWSDGANTLALAPGELIVYDRNPITNRLLEEAGLTLHEIESSELVRGRGGPRCMSMPLHRLDLS